MSAIVDQSSVISKELDYKQLKYSAPSYQYSRILPLSGTRSINLTGGANQEALFELPTKGFNLAQSLLTYKAVITGVTFTWSPADTFGEINQVELYSRSGQFLARVEDAHNYMKVVRPKETAYNDFSSNDAKSGLYPCNVASAANLTAVAQLGDFAHASKAYVEQLYNVISASTAGNTFYRQFKLNYMLNTLFALDKTLLFPEVLVLRVIFNSTKAGWNSASATDPTSTAGAIATATLTDLQLLLAIEQNQEIVNSLAEKIKSGFSLMIPFLYRYKSNVAGEAQSVSIRLNRGHGAVCKKIIHVLFHGTESASGTMFDHSNIGADTSTALKVTEYLTMLDNNRLQQFNLRCSLNEGDDYIFHKKQLMGSVIQNQRIYSTNWFHCDDFSSNISPIDVLPVDKDNLITGIDLSTERKWEFVGQTTLPGPWNHYTFICVGKMLEISPSMISVV